MEFGLSVTNLRLYRQFCIAYPHLISAIKDALINSNLKGIQIGQSGTDQLQSTDYKINSIHQSTTDELKQALVNEKCEVRKELRIFITYTLYGIVYYL
ncbi:hypothetical protein [Sphingobacterium sp.]|uniref:hypothetical protein n=1 Tax=Sphingobacterium sp. TaxID=341027 RepID=UPI0031CE0F2E